MGGLRVRGSVVLATICGAGLAALAGPAAASVEPDAQDGLAGAPRRAEGLVAQMTLDEKIGMVHGSGFTTGNGDTGVTPGIPRFGHLAVLSRRQRRPGRDRVPGRDQRRR